MILMKDWDAGMDMHTPRSSPEREALTKSRSEVEGTLAVAHVMAQGEKHAESTQRVDLARTSEVLIDLTKEGREESLGVKGRFEHLLKTGCWFWAGGCAAGACGGPHTKGGLQGSGFWPQCQCKKHGHEGQQKEKKLQQWVRWPQQKGEEEAWWPCGRG
ncbi:hypothetical protein P691DRAFT_782220 [Macrolepiota fuliginosa MF-IS2]|uniref:Uncharacterized protein n=1 Tax=Macrolepiota fuliginosa MF-IS2 TaxID=1400762 RepID=A0A9P5X048_9AGAR|nr:hypothetical protein P691DRAFT_782220 [Macrolepiota fuliginosa MF-IS2]